MYIINYLQLLIFVRHIVGNDRIEWSLIHYYIGRVGAVNIYMYLSRYLSLPL